MFGRVGIFSGPPERVDDDVTQQAREQTLRTLQTIPGFAGLHVFADRQTGKTIAISLWETEAAVQAWEQMRGPIVAEQVPSTEPNKRVDCMSWCSVQRLTILPQVSRANRACL